MLRLANTQKTGTTDAEHGKDLRLLETELTESRIALAHAAAALSTARQHAHEAQVRALRDSLTGLPNRELFDDRLAHAISPADRHDCTLAVMFLDLDQFKCLNDDYGTTAGDAALKTISLRLLQYVRDEHTVCRNGGDEFLYLLMNPRGRKNIEHIANSVLRTIAQPVPIADRELPTQRLWAAIDRIPFLRPRSIRSCASQVLCDQAQ